MDFRENAVERLVLPFLCSYLKILNKYDLMLCVVFYSSMNGHRQLYFIELYLLFSGGKIYTSI